MLNKPIFTTLKTLGYEFTETDDQIIIVEPDDPHPYHIPRGSAENLLKSALENNPARVLQHLLESGDSLIVSKNSIYWNGIRVPYEITGENATLTAALLAVGGFPPLAF